MPVERTYDTNQDADLWKDSFFSFSQVKRYICFTRFFPLANGKLNNVIETLSILEERETVPKGYTLIETTVDTNERAMKKKQLAAKICSRAAATDAITDLVLVRDGRPPAGYVLLGEINGLYLACKIGPVPKDSNLNNSYQLTNQHVLQPNNPITARPIETQTGASLLRQPPVRQASVAASQNFMEGVKFKLNSAYTTKQGGNDFAVAEVTSISVDDYKMSFAFENEVLQELGNRRSSKRI